MERTHLPEKKRISNAVLRNEFLSGNGFRQYSAGLARSFLLPSEPDHADHPYLEKTNRTHGISKASTRTTTSFRTGKKTSILTAFRTDTNGSGIRKASSNSRAPGLEFPTIRMPCSPLLSPRVTWYSHTIRTTRSISRLSASTHTMKSEPKKSSTQKPSAERCSEDRRCSKST